MIIVNILSMTHVINAFDGSHCVTATARHIFIKTGYEKNNRSI